jgi:Tol biopolymer transport system component
VLGLVSRQGEFEALEVPRANFRVPVAAPDGQSIAYIAGEGEDSAVRVYDRTRGRTIALTRRELSEGVAWRDNTSLSVASRTRPGVFLHTLDGSSTLLVPQPPAGAFIRNMSWSSDGNLLAYTLQTALRHDIWVLTMEQPDKPRPFHQRPGSEHSPRFSPDGQWLAYVSDESGPAEVYIRRYPEGPALLASTSGGTGPAWSRDGRELFFQGIVDGVRKMMAVTVIPDGASLRLGTPRPLFDLRTTQSTGEVVMYEFSNNIAVSYDVLPDGRFLMQRRTEPAAAREMILVQNWFAELLRTMPGK